MRILAAVDSFKGSMSSMEAADSLEKGFLALDRNIEVTKIPVSDGGEGMVDALISNDKGDKYFCMVKGPLGNDIEGFFGMSKDKKTAYIEVAAAVGLYLLERNQRNPLYTTSYGVGQLILKAIENGAEKIIVGLGGSSTNDGGTGMAQALGVKFFDEKGEELEGIGENLNRISKIDLSGMNPKINEVQVVAACDVDNPLTGERGATHIFAAQKGADEEQRRVLEEGMINYQIALQEVLGRDCGAIEGAGAAGGLGAAVFAYLDGEMMAGSDLMVEYWNIKQLVKEHDLVITGEGKFDYQTLCGKIPSAVINAAKSGGVNVVVIAGMLELEGIDTEDIGITEVISINPVDQEPSEWFIRAKENTEKITEYIYHKYLGSNSDVY